MESFVKVVNRQLTKSPDWSSSSDSSFSPRLQQKRLQLRQGIQHEEIRSTTTEALVCNALNSKLVMSYVRTAKIFGENARVLVNRYVFSCNGTMSEWQAYVVGSGAHPIEFHVWRSKAETG